MKIVFILALIGLCFYNISAQYAPIEIPDSLVLTKVDVQPQFADGNRGFLKSFYSHKINYPQSALEEEIFGKVFVQFTVDTTGRIADAAILKSSHEYLTDAANKHIKSISKTMTFKPAIKDNQKINFDFIFVYDFKMY